MNKQTLCSLDEAKQRIQSGACLIVAGEEALLKQLPKGNWIGGTIPYFVGEAGGVFTKDRVFVTEFPAYAKLAAIRVYDQESLSAVYTDAPANGFSFIIIPGMSGTHLRFAMAAPDYPAFATKPLVGWIAGIDLALLGKESPKIVDGSTGKILSDGAVVMHVALPDGKQADVGIINIFKTGSGDKLRFPKTGFSATEALVAGKTVNFADYVAQKGVDTKLPIVSNYGGTMINISFQAVDKAKKVVSFYAPVFEGAEYHVAAPVGDYIKDFTSRVPAKMPGEVIFSCNCILNYLYSQLEGKKTGQFVGPITFGEIAYQLVNQTLVYLQVLGS